MISIRVVLGQAGVGAGLFGAPGAAGGAQRAEGGGVAAGLGGEVVAEAEHVYPLPELEVGELRNRLLHAGFLWAFSALQASPGANAHYWRRREHGDWHNAAQRHLLNRFLGQLHHCLQTGQHFDEQRTFAPLPQVPAWAGHRPQSLSVHPFRFTV